MARRVVAPHKAKRRAPRTGTVHGASGKPRPTNQSAAPVPAQAPLKTFPLPGGRWMAEGQTDEGASVDPTDCFSLQRPLIRPCGPPSSLWGEGLALGQRPPLRRPNSAQNRAFFPLRPLTAGRKGDKMAPHRKKAVTGRSTRGPGPQRGAAWCKAPDGPAEGAREPRSGNAPPDRPRYGLRVRAHRARIQVVPRTVSVRPEPMARGVFVCLPLFLS